MSGRDLGAEVAFLTRALKAPTLGEAVPRLAERAREQSWSHQEFLIACLQRELAAREAHGGEGRIRAARFPGRSSTCCCASSGTPRPACRFYTRALRHGPVPVEVNTNEAGPYLLVLDELVPHALHVIEQDANNCVEADHARLKTRLRPMRGLTRFRSAEVIAPETPRPEPSPPPLRTRQRSPTPAPPGQQRSPSSRRPCDQPFRQPRRVSGHAARNRPGGCPPDLRPRPNDPTGQ